MSIKNIHSKLVWLFVVVLLLSIVSLETCSWGRYVFFLMALAVEIIYVSQNNGRIRLSLGVYQKMLVVFSLYIGASALWSMNPSDSLSKMVTLVNITICFYPIYIFYHDCDSVDHLINAIKWGSVFICMYTILYVGLNAMIRAASAENLRMANSFSNANTLGLCAALVIFLQTWQLLYNRTKKWEAMACFPAFIVLGASQSRKAIVFILIGLFMLVVLRYCKTKNMINTIVGFLIALIALVGLVYLASRAKVFRGLFERMESMIEYYIGSERGEVNHSTQIRNEMKKLGVEWWMKRPILGIGIGNPHILAEKYIDFDAYLHDNYVELLCGGGVVGTLLYYVMHVYCVRRLFQLRENDFSLFSLAIVWCALILVMDYGMVTYYSKLDAFYIMTIFLIVEELKQCEKKVILPKKGILYDLETVNS